MLTVDVHSHVVPPQVVACARRGDGFDGLRIERQSGQEWLVHRQGFRYPVPPVYYDPEARLRAMEERGISHAVLSIVPQLFMYWAGQAETAGFCRAANDALAAFCTGTGGRLTAVATLPLQDPAEAAGELTRAVRELGMRGAEIGPHVEGTPLHDLAVRPVLAAAASLGVPLIIHPYYVRTLPGLSEFYLTNLVGNPLATTACAAGLIFSGVIDDLPALRLVLMHGGGFLPYQIGRLDHGHRVRPEARGCARLPSEYLRNFWYDEEVKLLVTAATAGAGGRATVPLGSGQMLIEWDVPVAMADGLVLRADVFRPDRDGQWPVILSYGPYAKGLAFQEGYADQWRVMVAEHPDVVRGSSNRYQNWEVADPEKWVPDGYACVRVDSRGAGRSPGVLDPFSPRESRDLYECIEWAAAQPWSTGKVGLNGISYYAMNAWQVAALKPPHLAAMCVWEGAADFYRDATHHGGILSEFWQNWYRKQVTVVQHGVGDRGPRNPCTGDTVAGPPTLSDAELAANRVAFGEQIRAHPLDDEFHRARSARWDQISVPFLSAANWGGQGLHTRGNFEGFTRAASPRRWLEVHGLEHWTHFYTDYGVDLQKRFFACFLRGDDAGWRDQPPVQLQVRTLGGFLQRAGQEWPLANTRWTRLWLRPATLELAATPSAAPESARYAAQEEGVTFLTPPLQQQTEITGPVAARLYVSSTVSDADLFLVLRVFDPTGDEVTFRGAIDPHTPVAQGWLRMSHRKLDPELTTEYRPYHRHDEIQPLVPGEVYQADVEIWPTSVVVPAGYRIGLSVRGRDYERRHPGAPRLGSFVNEMTGCGPFLHADPADRPPALAGSTQTLWAGPGQAPFLLLPVIPPG